MIWGFAFLVRYPNFILLNALIFASCVMFYRVYLHSIQAPLNLKILAFLGYWALLLLLMGLWFGYVGHGLIIDVESFWYLR